MFISLLSLVMVVFTITITTMATVAIAAVVAYRVIKRRHLAGLIRHLIGRLPAPRRDRPAKPVKMMFRCEDGSLVEIDFANCSAVRRQSAPPASRPVPAPATPPRFASPLVAIWHIPAAKAAYKAPLPSIVGDFEEAINAAGISRKAFNLTEFRFHYRLRQAQAAVGLNTDPATPHGAPAPATAEQHELRRRAGLVPA